MTRLWPLLIVVSVSCGGGGSRQPSSIAIKSTWNAPAMLGHVPADSPYVVGVIDPIPSEFRDRMFAAADEKMATAVAALDGLPRDFDRSTLEPHVRAMFVVLDELRGKDMKRWGTELGFDPGGRFVLYGLGVWPVLRVAITDANKLRRLAKRVLAETAKPVDEGALGGRAYWKLTVAKVTMILAVLDDELVAAVLPTSIVDKALPLVLGVDKPARSLRETNVMPALIAQYKLMPSMVGYLDVLAAANIVTQRTSSSSRELDRPLAEATGAITQECRADIDRLVALVPRMVMGYRKLDKSGMHARIIAEMPQAITRELARLRVAVPGVTAGLSGAPLGSLGIAAKLDEAIPLLRKMTRHLADAPFRCTWFHELNQAAASLDARLAQPLPFGMRGVTGMSLVVDNFAMEPLDARGHVIVTGGRPHEILTKLLRSVPGMGGFMLNPDGRPVPIQIGLFGLPADVTAHAAASGDRAVLTLGPGSVTKATEVLSWPVPTHSPLMSLGMDVLRMRALGAVKDQDTSMEMKDLVLQLDVISEGLALDMFGTFPGP